MSDILDVEAVVPNGTSYRIRGFLQTCRRGRDIVGSPPDNPDDERRASTFYRPPSEVSREEFSQDKALTSFSPRRPPIFPLGRALTWT